MTIAITIDEVPEEQEVQQSLAPILEEARGIVVQTKEQHAAALEIIKRCGQTEKQVLGLFAKPKGDSHTAWKSIVAAEKSLLAPLREAKRLAGDKCSEFEREQERIRLEEQRLLEEAARKAEEERVLAEAAAAQDAGDYELAEQIVSEDIEVPVVKVEAKTAHVDGVSSRTLWSAEVTDKVALLEFVLANRQFANLIEPNTSALNALARSLKAEFKIPGVRAISKTSRAVRL
jgi:hypothetical protein